MENYLNSEDSAFFHITFPEEWESIKTNGMFYGDKGKIFVLRSSNLNIIFSLAMGQLPKVYDNEEMIILKFPQHLNNFQATEIGIDIQSNEPSMPIQNIIYRDSIPLENIELHSAFKYSIRKANKEATIFDMNQTQFDDYNKSFDLVYRKNNTLMKLIKAEGFNNYELTTL